MGETVWVVESGEYEQRSVDLVAASPEAAEAAVKEWYEDSPMTWEPLAADEPGWRLVGNGDGFTTVYDITPHEVVR